MKGMSGWIVVWKDAVQMAGAREQTSGTSVIVGDAGLACVTKSRRQDCDGQTRLARLRARHRGELTGQPGALRLASSSMKPAAMKEAMRSLTASKSSDLQMPPDSRSMRPVRPSVSIRAPVTK